MNKKNYDIAIKDVTHYFIIAETKEEALADALEVHNGGNTFNVEGEVKGIVCSECENVFNENEGRFSKYQEDTWLCDDCHDEYMDKVKCPGCNKWVEELDGKVCYTCNKLIDELLDEEVTEVDDK